MTMIESKKALAKLLEDPENKVLALLGKWGTGKTFLWNQVQAETTVSAVKSGLYVSLFGVASISQLKMSVLQEALTTAPDRNKILAKLSEWYGKTRGALRLLDERFGAADEAALILLPSLVKGRLLVLDDIERKHRDVDIDSVLGFIDEITLRHEARVLLIMNVDKLKDAPLWEQLRERVVDHEVQPNTTAAEAFEIASRLTPSVHAEIIRNAITKCGVTNIRVTTSPHL